LDINAADIAALEKILHWAEEQSLQDPNRPQEQSAAPPEEAPPEAPPEEEGDPALEIEVSSAPAPSVLGSHRFGGSRPPEEKRKVPVPRRGRY